ncbi:hypothetical protein OG730_22535 [Streptomyces sp. NBC_01298]|uniref:hypothetical protein n=1 Tax=Streptomyces sp. NBC_01298 TaxID=2903817 RepID=UPI002E0FD056|nr:hypothetical protein OG730_22535 [Streptomyces sp. NBC_01298]
MTRSLSIGEAVGLLEGELGSGQRALGDVATEDRWLAFLRFGRRLVDLGEWAREMTGRAAWATIHRFKPAEVRVYQEQL